MHILDKIQSAIVESRKNLIDPNIIYLSSDFKKELEEKCNSLLWTFRQDKEEFEKRLKKEIWGLKIVEVLDEKEYLHVTYKNHEKSN